MLASSNFVILCAWIILVLECLVTQPGRVIFQE